MLTNKTDNKTMPGFTCLNEECTALSLFGRMLNAGYDEIYGSDFCTCPICGAPAVKTLYISKRHADADDMNRFIFNKSLLCTNMLCEFSYSSVLNPIFKTQRAARCLKYPGMFDLPAYLQVLPVTQSKTVEDFLMALKTAGYNKVRFGLRGKDAPKKFFMTKLQKYIQAEYNTDIYNLISALDYGILNIIAYFDKSYISSVESDSNTDEKQKYPESYALNRILINDFNILGDVFEVNMQAERGMRSDLRDIMELQVASTDGDMVPLASLAGLRLGSAPKQINMFNKLLSTEINVMTDSSVSTGEIMRKIESEKLPAGYSVAWTGMSYQEKQNENKIIQLMALAILFAYLFLVAQYESWTIPVPIMMTVCAPVMGAIAGLLIAGESFSIYAQLGMVMLVGLAAKNAILMVEFSKQERAMGTPIRQAALNGASQRFRAVMMTALSFVFGVLPLVMASGAGAASRRAIGITTFSGMLVATCLGVVMTPCLYALVQSIRERFNSRVGIKMR